MDLEAEIVRIKSLDKLGYYVDVKRDVEVVELSLDSFASNESAKRDVPFSKLDDGLYVEKMMFEVLEDLKSKEKEVLVALEKDTDTNKDEIEELKKSLTSLDSFMKQFGNQE